MKKSFLAVGLLIVAFAQAQKLHFTVGQKMEVITNTTINAESMMGPTSGTITTADTYVVAETTGATTTLLKTPKHLKLDFRMGSQEMKVDSDNPNDMKGMLGEPVKDIMSQKPEFTIDAIGKIIAVKAAKKKPDTEGGGVMGAMLPGMDMAAGRPVVGGASLFMVLPVRQISIGDTWTDSLRDAANKSTTTYRVKDITADEILLEFTGDGTTVTSQEAAGMKVDINASFRTTGSVTLNKATSVIKQKTSTNTTETAMNLGGQAVNTTMKSTSVTTVRPL